GTAPATSRRQLSSPTAASCIVVPDCRLSPKRWKPFAHRQPDDSRQRRDVAVMHTESTDKHVVIVGGGLCHWHEDVWCRGTAQGTPEEVRLRAGPGGSGRSGATE